MKPIGLIIAIPFLLFSCMVNTTKIATQHVDKNTDKTTLHDIYNEFECISLETNDKCIFGYINKLLIYDNKFFILDNLRMKKIYVFNEDGTFSHTIGQKGGGPGEYTNLEDFTIDKEKKQLVVLAYPSTVFIYNLNGDFIRKQQLTSNSMLWNIASYPDGYVCSTNQQSALGDNLLHIYDKEFVLKNTLIEPLSFQIPLPPFISNPILSENNKLCYFDNFTSTLYTNITNESGCNGINLNIDEQMDPKAFKDVQQLFTKQRDYSFFMDAIIAKNVLYATFQKKGELCDMIYDLRTKKCRVSTAVDWRPKSLLYHDSYFYSSVSPSNLLDNKKDFNAKSITKFPITSESNPLILRYKAVKLK